MLYVVMWKDSGLFYNKATLKFDSDREGASIVNEGELEMMMYKFDDEIKSFSI
jgi:hypothetical protein